MSLYYYSDGTPTPVGPIDAEVLRSMHASGTVQSDTLVIAEGETSWSTYQALIASRASAGAPPAPPAAPAAPPPPVAVQKPVERFYYSDANNQSAGPVTRDEIVALKRRGVVNNSTPVIPVGDTTWGTYLSAVGPFGGGEIAGHLGENTAKVKTFMRNPVWYVAAYLIFMLPTYILPYLGSNSVTMRAACAMADSVSLFSGSRTHSCGFLNTMLFFHMAFLAILAFIAYARGASINKKWLIVFPILAAFFDLMPGFSSIPLAPTILHMLAIILGVVGVASTQTATRTY